MNSFITLTGNALAAVQVVYQVKDDLIDRINVYRANVDVTDVLSLEQINELESEAALHYVGVQA
jgi:hypothetical protein